MKVFGNPVPRNVEIKGKISQALMKKQYNFDPNESYDLCTQKNDTLHDSLGITDIVMGTLGDPIDANKGIVVGTIRMGFGHYRIGIAMASAARSKGLIPYWFDLLSFEGTTGEKIINQVEKLYSLGSRISQKSNMFNKYFWEPLNSESFKKLSQYVGDSFTTELLTGVYKNLPMDIPFIGTHSWTSQAAVKAGMTKVVTAICDNWPMALHYAEGAIHTVQSESSYLGYRIFREMTDSKDIPIPMPSSSIKLTGHYVDHELLVNLEDDCNQRIKRIEAKKERRLLFSVGGAGAQLDTLVDIIKKLKSQILEGKVTLFVNVGDHLAVWEGLQKKLPDMQDSFTTYFDDFPKVQALVDQALKEDIKGIHVFHSKNIYVAVYTTNLLMRCSDIMLTKPSELAYYPIPKLFIKRVGGHEAWGAIRGAEIGDSTIECYTDALLFPTLDLLIDEDDMLRRFIDNIIALKKLGIYDGAYKVIDIAMNA